MKKNADGFRVHWPARLFKWRDESGAWQTKRLPPEIKTERVAIVFARAFVEERSIAKSGVDRSPFVKEIAAKWLALRTARMERGELAPSSVKNDRLNVANHVAAALGELPVDAASLTTPVLRQWMRDLKGRLAPNTVRNVVVSATTMLGDALAEGWADMPANPLEHPAVRREVPPAGPKSEGPIVRLSAAAVAALIRCPSIPEIYRCRYAIAALGGLDDGEIAGLQWRHVHLDDAVPHVEVRQALQSVSEKGGAAIGRLKRPSRTRLLPLHPEASETIRHWRDAGFAGRIGRAPVAADPVFPNESGGAFRPRSADILRTHLGIAKQIAIVDGATVTFKALRRTFASLLAAANVPEDRRRVLMGHAANTVTERHYTKRELAQLAADVAAITLPTAGLGSGGA